jgi:hypothetical protein
MENDREWTECDEEWTDQYNNKYQFFTFYLPISLPFPLTSILPLPRSPQFSNLAFPPNQPFQQPFIVLHPSSGHAPLQNQIDDKAGWQRQLIASPRPLQVGHSVALPRRRTRSPRTPQIGRSLALPRQRTESPGTPQTGRSLALPRQRTESPGTPQTESPGTPQTGRSLALHRRRTVPLPIERSCAPPRVGPRRS